MPYRCSISRISIMKTNLVGIRTILKLIKAILLALIGISYLFFLTGSIYEAFVFPRTPQKVTLAQAVKVDLINTPDFLVFDQALYVSITDAVWQCASVRQSGYSSIFIDKRRTDAQFTDAEKTAVVFIQLRGFYDCQELKEIEILGELDQVFSRPVEFQSDPGGTTIIAEDSDVLVYWIRNRTPLDAMLQAIFMAGFPLLVWGYYQSRKNRQ